MLNTPQPVVGRLLLLVLLCGALLWLRPLGQVAQAASVCCTGCDPEFIQNCYAACDCFGTCAPSIPCARNCHAFETRCQTCDPGC